MSHALAGTAGRPLLLRRREGRPQLKRDPLGRPLTVPNSRAVVVLSLSLLAYAPGLRPASQPLTLTAPPDTAGTPPEVRSLHDSTLAAVGLPSLAGASLPPGYREFRLSQGHGMILGGRYPLLRIVQSPDHVAGELYWMWCAPCRAELAPLGRPIDWATLLRRFDSLGVATFRAPVPRGWISDAGDLVVEVRVGRSYRAYDVNAPDRHSETEYAVAREVFEVIDSLARLAREP